MGGERFEGNSAETGSDIYTAPSSSIACWDGRFSGTEIVIEGENVRNGCPTSTFQPFTSFMFRSYLLPFDAVSGVPLPFQFVEFLQEFTVEIDCRDPDGKPYVSPGKYGVYVKNELRPQDVEHISLWSPRNEEIKENGVWYLETDIDGALFGFDAPGLNFRIEPAYYYSENGVRVGGFCTDYFNKDEVMQCAKIGDIFPDDNSPKHIVPLFGNEIGFAYKRSARFWCESDGARASEQTPPVIDEFANEIAGSNFYAVYDPVERIEVE